MRRFLKICGIILAAEVAAVAVNWATGTNVGSWMMGGAILWWVTS